ncbi:RHOT2 [Cordylochernes scorpioides]|uniref:RHOT2 n=1 Tax=Cordylochernes scorpioides TaxID=51811 RepID=A0ABY6LF32_9ARAC|nr:RHOT2 [Cordylochernes scorpioides]
MSSGLDTNQPTKVAPHNGGKRDEVRILLVGEPGVGKTSLILSLVCEEFPQDVPPRAEEITIPADVTPEHIPTHIVDYSAQEQGESILEEEVYKAHVVCIVYAVDNDETIDKITTFWLPFIRKRLGESHRTPVVLIGNKADLVDYSSLDLVIPIMNEFTEIETCVECSAKTLQNISELFYYAQKAVLHPIAPLYLTESRSLTEKCRRALSRVFKLCDSDNDGVLNDKEVNAFQMRCFNAPLQGNALADIKNIVKKNVPNGIVKGGLSLEGFLFLHTLFIQRGRHETTWTVLRKFGYSNDINLRMDYVYPHIHVPEGSSTELTQKGLDFFRGLFDKFDKDKDGFLSPSEVQDLFSTCPAVPWGPELPNTVETSINGWVSQNGFLSYWVLVTLLNVKRTLEYLAYLGYVENPGEPQTSAVTVTREKGADPKKQLGDRNVYLCQVIGPQGAGKSSIMQAFLGRTLEKQDDYVCKFPPSDYAVRAIQVCGKIKYLVLHEIDLFSLNTTISKLDKFCDVACLVYDTSFGKSFEYIARIFEKNLSSTERELRVPVLIIGAKADEQPACQQYTLQPNEFCQKHKLPSPHLFSARSRIRNDVFIKLGTLAAFRVPPDNLGEAVMLRGTVTPFIRLTTTSSVHLSDHAWQPCPSPSFCTVGKTLSTSLSPSAGHRFDVAPFQGTMPTLQYSWPCTLFPILHIQPLLETCIACGSSDLTLAHRYWSGSSIRPLIREAFNIIQQPPYLQGYWLFGQGLEDDAILASVESSIHRFFLSIEIRGERDLLSLSLWESPELYITIYKVCPINNETGQKQRKNNTGLQNSK